MKHTALESGDPILGLPPHYLAVMGPPLWLSLEYFISGEVLVELN